MTKNNNPQGFGMDKRDFETEVYKDLKKHVFKILEDIERFCKKDNIIIFERQMSTGKSKLQGKDLPGKIHKEYPNVKYIFRLCPTDEVADDETFKDVQDPFKYIRLPQFRNEEEFIGFIDLLEDTSKIYCFSFTHALFRLKYETLVDRIGGKSVLIIEEAHQFIGSGDPGADAYKQTTGYRSPYSAATARKVHKWAKDHGRVIGFTATATKHHHQDTDLFGDNLDQKYTQMFDIGCELAPREMLIGSQSWLNNETEYEFTPREPITSVSKSVQDAIDSLFKREKQLRALQSKDPNIDSKLTGLFTCGTRKGVWGCPIHGNGIESKRWKPSPHDMGMVEIIIQHLSNLGFDPSLQMIATLQEKGGGGNRIWDLDGNFETVKTFPEIKSKLLDPNDPLRYLIVVQRARSGISVNNLGAMVVGGIREPALIRTMIPCQVYGRMLRANPGTGTLIMNKYANNLEAYLKYYREDNPHVDIQTMVDAIRIANHWDLWYPTSVEGSSTTDTWKESLDELKEYYVNTVDEGEIWMCGVIPTYKPPLTNFLPIDLTIERECNGELVKYNVNQEVSEWKGDGTLDAFFKIR